MLISYWKVSIPFLDDAKLPKHLLGIKILNFYAYLKGLEWKNWRGGLTRLKFWSLAIKIICNKKVQNSVFLSAALHGENGFQVWKWDFLLFFPIFTKGIQAKFNELESESDSSP